MPDSKRLIHQKQFGACVQTLFEMPAGLIENIFEAEEVLFEQLDAEIQQWHYNFQQEILGSKRGYPLQPVLNTPELEDTLLKLAVRVPSLQNLTRKRTRPSICLTHDIDYLSPTLQMNLKRIINKRKLTWSCLGEHYLDSLETLLKLDADAAGRTGASTLFIPCPVPSKTVAHRLKQWLIDPSYKPGDQLFNRFISLIYRYDCEVGLHGSFFSLTDKLLSRERTALEEALCKPIFSGRQHWLNLPQPDAFSIILEGGLTIDSTLGWNGAIGFRGGFARPFPLCLPKGTLWEIPLLLMDGPMFDDLQLDTKGVVEESKSLLEEVYKRGGCVAINWHERSAHPEYGWSEAYAQILDWAKDKGFHFMTVSEAIAEAQAYGMKERMM